MQRKALCKLKNTLQIWNIISYLIEKFTLFLKSVYYFLGFWGFFLFVLGSSYFLPIIPQKKNTYICIWVPYKQYLNATSIFPGYFQNIFLMDSSYFFLQKSSKMTNIKNNKMWLKSLGQWT